jgi:hypothetical protein
MPAATGWEGQCLLRPQNKKKEWKKYKMLKSQLFFQIDFQVPQSQNIMLSVWQIVTVIYFYYCAPEPCINAVYPISIIVIIFTETTERNSNGNSAYKNQSI